MNINAPSQRSGAPAAKVMPTPFARRISDNLRGHIVAVFGEFVGTTAFFFLAFAGAQTANNIPTSSGQSESVVGNNPQQLLYIALVFGFSLAINAWIFFRISGGLFNPAVTLAMFLIGALGWFRAILLTFTQIVAGIVAAGLVSTMFAGGLTVETTLNPDTSITRGVFIEALLTAELVFAILMLAAEKHRGTFLAPLGIGLTLFVCHLAGVNYTGCSLNPARTFGPAVINHHFNGYHYIYWVGPLMGALIAVAFYQFVKFMEYNTINPDCDHDGQPKPVSCCSCRSASDSESDDEKSEQEPMPAAAAQDASYMA